MKSFSELKSFVPFFQPQFNYETGEMIGAEVLVRRILPDGSVQGPAAFIDEFEKSGFMTHPVLSKISLVFLDFYNASDYLSN